MLSNIRSPDPSRPPPGASTTGRGKRFFRISESAWGLVPGALVVYLGFNAGGLFCR
jgi:hypothetical protein